MLETPQVEELICIVSAMDRASLVDQLLHFPRSTFPIDFTPKFLNSLSSDRLKHVLVALCMQCGQLPELSISAAA